MRFMMMAKGNSNCSVPTPELSAAIGRLSAEMMRAGVMLDSGGSMWVRSCVLQVRPGLAGDLHRGPPMNSLTVHAPELDRVRANTWPDVTRQLDRRAALRTRWAATAASPEAISAHLERLDTEWDFDRVLETEASIMGLLGLALGLTGDRRLLVLPGVVSAMVLLHAVHGWYPLLPVFRRMGVRSRDEIDRERYAVKAVRGDFDAIPRADARAAARAAAAWEAVCA